MGELFVVATPIGNLGDITKRAIDTLRHVDLIAAEDTRRTVKLLNHLEIKCPLISYHKFSEKEKCGFIADKIIHEDLSVALVSDAGTPCISDPGSILVNECVSRGIQVTGISGASAAVTAMSICGFAFGTFLFLGFLPRENKKRAEFIKNARESFGDVIVFYESPKRIKKTIEELSEIFTDADFCLCRDLTKKFETTYRGSALEVLDLLNNDINSELGEYTVVVHKKSESNLKDDEETVISDEALLVDEMVKSECTIKEAIENLLAKYPELNKNKLYKASLSLKKRFS